MGGKSPGWSHPAAPLASSTEGATEARAVTGRTKGDEITPSSSTKSFFGLCLDAVESQALPPQGTSHQQPFGVPSPHQQSAQLPKPGTARAFRGNRWGPGEARSTPGASGTHCLPEQPRLGQEVPRVVPITGGGIAAERCQQHPTGAPSLPQAPSAGACLQPTCSRKTAAMPPPVPRSLRPARLLPGQGACRSRQPLHPWLQAGPRAEGLHREGASNLETSPGRGAGSPRGGEEQAGRQARDTRDSPLLAVAMCPCSSRPCAKLQRHGQEAILRGCRRSRAPELGREQAGLGRGRQSWGGQLLPQPGPGASRAPQTRQHCTAATPALLRHKPAGEEPACSSGASGSPALGSGGQHARACAQLCPNHTGRAGAAAGWAVPLPSLSRPHGVTRPALAPALPALRDAASPCLGKGGFLLLCHSSLAQQPGHNHHISQRRAESTPCLSFPISRPTRAPGHRAPRWGSLAGFQQ